MSKNQAVCEKEFLTLPGFVEFMNRDGKVMSREFIYRMAKAGNIPSYRVNRKIFVRVPEVLAALRQQKE